MDKPDVIEKLLPCPFCDGEGVLKTERERSGYGEYETHETYHVVMCSNCGSRGRRYHQDHLIKFTSHTVSEFRSNPILRAKVEDDYEAYCKQTKGLAVTAWQRRSNGENRP